jgi:hypothetical protein
MDGQKNTIQEQKDFFHILVGIDRRINLQWNANLLYLKRKNKETRI